MNTDRHGWGSRERGSVSLRTQLWLGVFAVGAAVLLQAAQPLNIGRPINPKYTDYYEAPNELQKRAIVTGSEAETEGANLIRLKKVHIETYQVTGELDAVLDADDAVYDRESHTVSSPGRIKVKTPDDQMLMQGVGFNLSLTNQSLYISNNFQISLRGFKLAPRMK